MNNTYPLAPQGIFKTIQGEGLGMGEPMVFIRLAGCSVGCAECDTDYRVASRMTAREIATKAIEIGAGCEWAWVTGGEPTDHDLGPLLGELRRAHFLCALATAGTELVRIGSAHGGWDFVSVSPHDLTRWVQRSGNQLNIVPGLNGLRLEEWEPHLVECQDRFTVRYVTPCWYSPADRAERVAECVEWVRRHPSWRIGIQAHKFWGLA